MWSLQYGCFRVAWLLTGPHRTPRAHRSGERELDGNLLTFMTQLHKLCSTYPIPPNSIAQGVTRFFPSVRGGKYRLHDEVSTLHYSTRICGIGYKLVHAPAWIFTISLGPVGISGCKGKGTSSRNALQLKPLPGWASVIWKIIPALRFVCFKRNLDGFFITSLRMLLGGILPQRKGYRSVWLRISAWSPIQRKPWCLVNGVFYLWSVATYVSG